MEMKFDVLTLFPEMFRAALGESIIGRACDKGILGINLVNIRDFAAGKHKTTLPFNGDSASCREVSCVNQDFSLHSPASDNNGKNLEMRVRRNKVDDYAYGGGIGMVMQPDPIYNAYQNLDNSPFLVYMSPQGKPLTQSLAKELSAKGHIAILCGHYEGVDERILEEIVDMEISIGDYVLTGGEIPAMALIDCISRMVPGVLPDEEAFANESHFNDLLEYPQYTRPDIWMGKSVPEVLLSGHAENIATWRKHQSLKRTRSKRPDLFDKYIKDKPKIALFGGTFDPIHKGHLHVAESALNELGLDKLIFIPAGNPPHKMSGTDKRHRYHMTRIAAQGNPKFEVSDYEIRRKTPSYTVETLKYFEKKYSDYRLFYIVGADSLKQMSTWYKPQEIFEISDIICAGRSGEKNFEIPGANIIYLNAPDYNASSTAVRSGNLSELPKGVKEYILKNSLYIGE